MEVETYKWLTPRKIKQYLKRRSELIFELREVNSKLEEPQKLPEKVKEELTQKKNQILDELGTIKTILFEIFPSLTRDIHYIKDRLGYQIKKDEKEGREVIIGGPFVNVITSLEETMNKLDEIYYKLNMNGLKTAIYELTKELEKIIDSLYRIDDEFTEIIKIAEDVESELKV